jgi:hypothetical protein
LAILCDRFRNLSLQYRHVPRGSHSRDADARRHYAQAQTELFQLAQAICKVAEPAVQSELEAARLDLVEQIRLHVKTPVGPCVLPHVRSKLLAWSDYQITPELTSDPSIAYNAVLKPALARLKAALRAQWAVLNRVVRGS